MLALIALVVQALRGLGFMGLGNFPLRAVEPAECRALGVLRRTWGFGVRVYRVQGLGFRASEPAESWEVGHRAEAFQVCGFQV